MFNNLSIIVIISLAFYSVAIQLPKERCRLKAEELKSQYEWRIFKGCSIEQNGEWVDYGLNVERKK